MPLKILHVVGARPNFVKAAAVVHALAAHEHVHQIIVHTGQHYDHEMSNVFFAELDMPAADINLRVGSGTHAQQTAEVMQRLEPVVDRVQPDWVLVYGDVNSTLAAALVCAKKGIRTAHVEAGLRSFDRTMPEEINRVLTDHACDLLFTPSEDADQNLAAEGIPAARVKLVGNVMIDTLVRMLPSIRARELPAPPPQAFVLVTLHRPSNVDDLDRFRELLSTLATISHRIPVLFPVHPRTRQQLHAAGFHPNGDKQLRLLDPLSYVDFLCLQTRATAVVTDSGGVQEETSFLNVPCLTFRKNTERPVTTDLGTNTLVGCDPVRLEREIDAILAGKRKHPALPSVWDGRAASRIAAFLTSELPKEAPGDAVPPSNEHTSKDRVGLKSQSV